MQTKDNEREIIRETLEEELTENELMNRFVVSQRNSNKRKYDANLKQATKTILSADYMTVDGSVMSVGDKIALNVVKGVLDKGSQASTDELINLQKATGEYQEKQEVQVNGFDQLMARIKGDSEF